MLRHAERASHSLFLLPLKGHRSDDRGQTPSSSIYSGKRANVLTSHQYPPFQTDSHPEREGEVPSYHESGTLKILSSSQGNTARNCHPRDKMLHPVPVMCVIPSSSEGTHTGRERGPSDVDLSALLPSLHILGTRFNSRNRGSREDALRAKPTEGRGSKLLC